MKYINDWTRKEFEALRERRRHEDIGEFDSLIILPTRRLHESGFRCMDYVAVIGEEPICRLSGCSDLICLDKMTGGKIDCLKGSGLLSIFTQGKLKVDIASFSYSTLELHSTKK